jgi:predicted O-linked N-acetylglucosamine transferase (SPINDLY family)
LTETIAETDESYRDAAVTLANRNVLGTIRQGLRSRILASDAGNPKVYTQRVEQAYRAMWMQWCASDARSGG